MIIELSLLTESGDSISVAPAHSGRLGTAYRFVHAAYRDCAARYTEPAQTIRALGATIGFALLVVASRERAAAAPALALPQRLDITITGNPATPEFIAGRIAAAVSAQLGPALPAGASLRLGPILPAPQPLPSGFLTDFQVDVSLAPGDGAPATGGTLTVGVTNAGLAAFSPALLAFADDPERITADGVLSRTTVDAGTPIRLYYYHENRGARRRFCVVLGANGSVRTQVALVEAVAGPNIDVMTVGHAATKTFLARQRYNEGSVREIAGGRPILIRDTLVGPGDGIVGALDLRVLYGGPVTATVLAIPPSADPAAYLYGPKLPDDGHGRHGTFALGAFGQRVIAYTAGGRDAVITYGGRAVTPPNARPADAGHDYGDYGVLQHVAFDVDNPNATPATLYLFERPLGGAVRSTFAVDGRIVEVGCVRVPQRYLVSSYTLAAHAAATLDVLTMTDGGSSYPLELGLSATPPQLVPPLTAPDGCFPKPARPVPAQPARRPPGR